MTRLAQIDLIILALWVYVIAPAPGIIADAAQADWVAIGALAP